MSASAAFRFVCAATIFVSAFLLFVVQPLIARFILPWFGGAAAVWTTCLLFFQVVLLGGYCYAHVLTRLLGRKAQAGVHVALLAGCALMLPIAPAENLAPGPEQNPTLAILRLLLICLGLPYFALSATSPLLQHWFARVEPRRSAYRLYALSNLGSLLALVSYPTVVEPMLARQVQSRAFSIGFRVFAALCAAAAILHARARGEDVAASVETGDAPKHLVPIRAVAVLMLAACASLLLLATNNVLCQDIAPFPFLWVLPLGLYLLSFILCFEYPSSYHRGVFIPLTMLATLGICYLIFFRLSTSMAWQVVGFSGALFVFCMLCHGEVARLRPGTTQLTAFFLLVSLGGVIGALLVSVAAPLIFTGFFELQIGVVMVWVILLGVLWGSSSSRMQRFRLPVLWLVPSILFSVVMLLLYSGSHLYVPQRLARVRNFYGVAEVRQIEPADVSATYRALYHNSILHGLQYTASRMRATPATYYAPPAGVAVALQTFRADGPRRVGLVGLGTGTLATYGKQKDFFEFYEIDPAVVELARKYFTFLSDCDAETAIQPGDARLTLAQQEPQQFDVLVLDAFSGDAIPVHLLTTEAFELYLRHLKPGGVLAIHLTNKHLDLLPVVWAGVSRARLAGAVFSVAAHGATIYPSDWMLASKDQKYLRSLTTQPSFRHTTPRAMRPWTDDHAPLFPLLK
ncbi:MAG TPA: fused MFS/spermidine synthase [Tepidisphaeraceae bacterium]|jgi:hypothetical protein